MNPSLRKILLEALEKSGEVLRRRFGKVSVRYKGRANLVTQADLESQRAILSVLRRRVPRHDFIAEEKKRRSSGSDFLWIIDPLDGTTNYAHGYPAACVSIGLLRLGEPVLGGVYDPFRRECFTAERGVGAALNGKPLRVSAAKSLKESLLVTGFPYDRAKHSKFYIEFYRSFMVRCHDVRRSGSAALDMAWIAAGRADGFWEFNLSPWDVCAGLLLVREAGGRVTDFSGQEWRQPDNFGRQTLATNGLVHEEMLRLLRRTARAAEAS
ncbi:MAG: inositol monophosphatase [Elusimicrobia bacterium]|nr:inositol monophosphatase [Elusimicrobiota bacterium]